MDVDPCQTEFTAPGCSQLAINLPTIDENLASESKTPKQRLIELLDILEGHVEKLRKDAIKLEDDRDALLASLDSVKNANLLAELSENDRDDVLHFADRIVNRCLTVELQINTQRDRPQEEALHQINHLIDGLVVGMKIDAEVMRSKCIAYLNSCSSHNVQGILDKNFESLLLGCTVDDQKRVKKRLQGLHDYINKLNVISDDE
ncbi:hypothetical protein PPYR_00378 [Photinus pyralis]|uniref:BAG domain-containing protein n=1 Tax=Photinus pyralis TaxID=7054 RepID=A0A1Y1LPU6_PHOPY|nr:BAG family molecular chaperone regulator 2 [Photinus pyralis]KAB0803408.1 hypothetical protein PPYR_00378 [Photinus pyralis]